MNELDRWMDGWIKGIDGWIDGIDGMDAWMGE